MHARYYYLVLLLGLALLLGACDPTSSALPAGTEVPVDTSAPVDTPIPPTLPTGDFFYHDDPLAISLFSTSSYTLTHRERACTSELDQEQARSRYFLPILWTFQVNFDVTLDGAEHGRPLGCLRLYERIGEIGEEGSSFVPIDGGGILIDTCGASSSVGLNPEDGTATLDGRGYVACRMNLAEWVTQLADRPGLFDDEVRDLLGNFAPIPLYDDEVPLPPYEEYVHEYPNFTMIASVTLTQVPAGASIELVEHYPLIHYEPSAVAKKDAARYAVNLSVHAIKDENNLGVTFPHESCHPMGACQSHNYDEPVTWWYDYRTEGEPPSYLAYRFKDISRMSDPWRAPDGTVPPAPSAGKQALPFWIGEAILYIGHNPKNPGDGTHGIIDDTLVDPSDSKPTN